MKKLLFSFSLLLIGNLSYSQVSFGVKSGINIATTRDLIAYPRNRLGWYAGGLVKIPINKRIAFEPELYFSAKGNRSYNQIGPLKRTTRLNYINMPLLINYKIIKNTHLLFGPELGYMTSAQIALSNGEVFNVSSSYHRHFDISLGIGISYTIWKSLGADVRYNYGFNTLYTTDTNGERSSFSNGANRVFEIGLNYLIK